MEKYKIIVEDTNIKEEAEGMEQLKKVLEGFYEKSKTKEWEFKDVKVYNSEDEDISESQFIEEMVCEIMDNDN